MKGYEIPSEALTLETVRAIDNVFCREQFPSLPALDESDQIHQFILQRGVNEALARVLPTELLHSQPRIYPSTRLGREKADQFLFDSGSLWLAQRLLTQLRAGFLEGRIDQQRRVQGAPILVLTAADKTLYHERIGHAGVGWLSSRAHARGIPKEEELRRVREMMLPHMTERLLRGVDDGGELFPDGDSHFHECAKVYMSRMPYQDLLSGDDRIGGRPYSDYVQALIALSTLSEARLCTAGILISERPGVEIRDFLTIGAFADELIEAVAGFLDAGTDEVNHLLCHLALSPYNRSTHLARGTPAWAPIIQTSANFCILPCYGLDMNPFIFLATELRERYKSDWFEAANAREGRWVSELRAHFPGPRWCCADGIKIKRGGKVVTDIDFVAYDAVSRMVALFQLKWQQPAESDEKTRRNNASNLMTESNRWVAAVSEWTNAEGLNVLAMRLGLQTEELGGTRLFVLGRYGAHFSGHSNADPRAAWSNWGHFEHERTLHPAATAIEMFANLVKEMAKAKDDVQQDSLMFPLPGLALVVNPSQSPRDMRPAKSP